MQYSKDSKSRSIWAINFSESLVLLETDLLNERSETSAPGPRTTGLNSHPSHKNISTSLLRRTVCSQRVWH